ncbi:hypothetical protein HMPREF2946_03510 [Actinomyces sp. HMSC062G12]|nr:hypothetical protein HMPREF2946_03510 [Actinomyces sp. HMSC062G12]
MVKAGVVIRRGSKVMGLIPTAGRASRPDTEATSQVTVSRVATPPGSTRGSLRRVIRRASRVMGLIPTADRRRAVFRRATVSQVVFPRALPRRKVSRKPL